MLASMHGRKSLSALALTGLLSLSFLNGCATSSTQQIHDKYPDYSYQSFQEQLAGKDATIYFGDGTVRHGKAVLIDEERISWLETDQVERSKVATSEVWKLEVSEDGNAGAGAAVGFLIGAGLGAAIGAASDTDSDYGDAGMGAAMGAIAFGVLGLVFGAIAGGTSNTTDTYEVNPDLAPPLPPEPATDPMDDWFEDF